MKKALLIILLMAIAPYLKAQKVTHHKAKHQREIKYPSCDTSGQLIDQPCIMRVHYVQFKTPKADTTETYFMLCHYYVADDARRTAYPCDTITVKFTYKKGTEKSFIVDKGVYKFDGYMAYFIKDQQIFPVEIN